MKKCPYCAEDIQNDAIKCRFCNELFNKKHGVAGKIAGGVFFIVSLIILILSVGFVSITYLQEHGQHGHYMSDPIHLIGLVVVVVSAYVTWRSLNWKRK